MIRALTTWLVAIAVIAVWIAVMVATMGQPYGLQITIAIGYTLAVTFQVFFATRIGQGFDIRDSRVRGQFPKLLLIHSAFLLVLLCSLALSSRCEVTYPRWLFEQNRKGVSNLVFIEIVVGTCIAMGQVLWSRLILARALGYEDWRYWEGCWGRAKPRLKHHSQHLPHRAKDRAKSA